MTLDDLRVFVTYPGVGLDEKAPPTPSFTRLLVLVRQKP